MGTGPPDLDWITFLGCCGGGGGGGAGGPYAVYFSALFENLLRPRKSITLESRSTIVESFFGLEKLFQGNPDYHAMYRAYKM